MGVDGVEVGLAIAALLLAMILYPLCWLASLSIWHSRVSELVELAERRVLGAKLAIKVIDSADRAVLAVHSMRLVCLIVSGISMAVVAEWVSHLFYVHTGVGGLPWLLALLVMFFVIVTILLALAQLAKATAASYPERTISLLAPGVCLLLALLGPLLRLVQRTISGSLDRFDLVVPREREVTMTAEKLSELVETSSQAGEIEDHEREMIKGVVEFGDTLVREVMTPRSDIVSVRESDPLPQVIDTFLESGSSRVLVVGEGLDDVRGLYVAKDFISLIGKGQAHFDPKDFLRRVISVDGSKPLNEVFKTLNDEATHLAVVLDEHGGVDGVITMEDLLEEIVGDIADEYDDVDELSSSSNRIGEFLIEGGALIDDVNDRYGFDFPKGEYDTIAGFIIHQLGRIPAHAETLSFNGHSLRVEGVEQNRITSVKILTKTE